MVFTEEECLGSVKLKEGKHQIEVRFFRAEERSFRRLVGPRHHTSSLEKYSGGEP